jgi:hypothetical protein
MTLPYIVTFSYNHNYCDSDGETLQKRISSSEILFAMLHDGSFVPAQNEKKRKAIIHFPKDTHTRHPTIFEKNEFYAIESSAAFYFAYIFSCFTNAS